MPRPLTGLWPPVSTPFAADGSIDEKRLVAHSKRLLADGADGLAILGTTSEANSQSVEERLRQMELHVAAGIPAERLLPGTGACAIDDVVTLSRRAGELGCSGVLMLPPFYYKNVTGDGIFAFFARVIEKLGAKAPRILLYHIPQQAVVGFPLDLVRRLREAFPEVVVGLKDSSGNWENTKAIIDAFPGFAVFPGSESNALRALKAGAAGFITASGNANAFGISRLIAMKDAPEAPRMEEEVNAVRLAMDKRGIFPTTKAVLAARYGDDAWLNMRPPLLPLPESARADLVRDPAIVRLLETAPR